MADNRTLYEILAQAVATHERIQAARAAKSAAEQGVRQARAERYPRLAATANIGREYIDPPGDGISTTKTRNYQSLQIDQLLYDFGRTRSGIGIARADLARSEAGVSAVTQDIIFQGIHAYLDVHRYAERLRLAKESEERLKKLTGIESHLVDREAGLASDVLQAKSQLAGARALRARAEGELKNARHRFVTIYGFDMTDEEIHEMTIPPKPVDYLPSSRDYALAGARKNSLDLIGAAHDIDMARHRIRFRKARYYPGLYLVGEGRRRENDLGIDGTWHDALGKVELNWELFSGGRDRAAVAQARHTLSEFENRRDDLSRLVREQVLVAWENLLTSRENARFLKEQADIMESFLEMATRERRLGTRSLLDVLNGEVTYLNALSNAISADIDQHVAMYGMLYVMGVLELDIIR